MAELGEGVDGVARDVRVDLLGEGFVGVFHDFEEVLGGLTGGQGGYEGVDGEAYHVLAGGRFGEVGTEQACVELAQKTASEPVDVCVRERERESEREREWTSE